MFDLKIYLWIQMFLYPTSINADGFKNAWSFHMMTLFQGLALGKGVLSFNGDGVEIYLDFSILILGRVMVHAIFPRPLDLNNKSIYDIKKNIQDLKFSVTLKIWMFPYQILLVKRSVEGMTIVENFTNPPIFYHYDFDLKS